MAGLPKQVSEWLRRIEEVFAQRECVSVELRESGRVFEGFEWETIDAWLAGRELREETVKLAVLDKMSRQPERQTPETPQERLAALKEQQAMLLKSAGRLVGTAFELSAMISALEKDLPRPPAPKKKLAKAHRKRIAKEIAALEAVCKRPRMLVIDGGVIANGFSAA